MISYLIFKLEFLRPQSIVVEEGPPLEEEQSEASDQDLRRELRENFAWILIFFRKFIIFI